jgi:hypothetical protein
VIEQLITLPRFKIRGHLIDGAQAWAAVSIYKAEPDVGINASYIALEDISSLSGRELPRISKKIFSDRKLIQEIQRRVADEL